MYQQSSHFCRTSCLFVSSHLDLFFEDNIVVISAIILKLPPSLSLPFHLICTPPPYFFFFFSSNFPSKRPHSKPYSRSKSHHRAIPLPTPLLLLAAIFNAGNWSGSLSLAKRRIPPSLCLRLNFARSESVGGETLQPSSL